eukprot:365993-Chlamydomonas_euryale.AAC.8
MEGYQVGLRRLNTMFRVQRPWRGIRWGWDDCEHYVSCARSWRGHGGVSGGAGTTVGWAMPAGPVQVGAWQCEGSKLPVAEQKGRP